MINELIDSNQERLNSVFISVISTAIVMYYFVAICGFLTFGDTVDSNILNNYSGNPNISIILKKLLIYH